MRYFKPSSSALAHGVPHHLGHANHAASRHEHTMPVQMKWHGIAVAGAITLTTHGGKRPMRPMRQNATAPSLAGKVPNTINIALDLAQSLQLAEGRSAVRPSQHAYVLLGATSLGTLDLKLGQEFNLDKSTQPQAPARKIHRRRMSHRETHRHDGPAVPDFRQRPVILGFTDRTHYLAMVAGTAILQLRAPVLRKERGLPVLMPVVRLKEEWPCTGQFCHRSGTPRCDRVRCRQLQALLLQAPLSDSE